MTTPNPPKLFSSLEELVQQDKIGFFTEYGSRTLNIGKDDPPGTNLRFLKSFLNPRLTTKMDFDYYLEY